MKATTLALRFFTPDMTDLREMFSARVLPIVKQMLASEATARGLSEGQLIDDLVLTYCRSDGAVRLLRDYGRRHPLVMAVAEVEAAAEIRETTKSRPKAK